MSSKVLLPVIPTLSAAKGRNLGGGVVRRSTLSHHPATQIPPLRSAQGRDDIHAQVQNVE